MALGDTAECDSEYVGAVFAVFIAVFSCWDCDLLELFFFTVLGVAVFCCYFSWNYLWIFYSVFLFLLQMPCLTVQVFLLFLLLFSVTQNDCDIFCCFYCLSCCCFCCYWSWNCFWICTFFTVFIAECWCLAWQCKCFCCFYCRCLAWQCRRLCSLCC